MKIKRLLGILAVLVLVAGWLATDELARRAEARYNGVRNPGPYRVSERAAALHKDAFVADLHADSLLWNRDLTKHGTSGQVDLPRLAAGNVGLQVFGVVTHSPRGQNFRSNTGARDQVTLLAMAQKWPPWTWWSRYRRALYQGQRLKRLARGSEQLTMIGSRADLETLVAKRRTGEKVTGAFLGLEGAHALEGEVGRIEGLYDAGFRMLGLAHFFDNDFAGSAHGVEKGGLTERGRQLIREAERLGIAIDLAHASPRALREATAMATKPMLVSHGGVKGTCDNPRTLSDNELRAVAATGGIIGLGLFEGAVCGSGVDATVAAIVHAIRVVGPEHVALGSDFDGAVTAPIGADGLALLTESLLRRGLDEATIEMVLGGNVLRFSRATLPAE